MNTIQIGEYVCLKNLNKATICKVIDIQPRKLAVQECTIKDTQIEDNECGCIYILNERDGRYQTMDRPPLVAYYHKEKKH